MIKLTFVLIKINLKFSFCCLKIPDMVVYNSAAENQFLTLNSNTNAIVFPDGYVHIIYNVASLKTRCRMVIEILSKAYSFYDKNSKLLFELENVRKFPFDEQKCSFVIGSWVNFLSNLSSYNSTSNLNS